jgi:signal transduction histidine kinase
MGIGLRNKGYRFRVYLFAGLIVLLVLTSFTFALGVVWYSKHTTALIIEKDFRAREIERSVVDLLLSMERNRKKYVLLGKPEYKAHFDEDSEQFRHELARLGALGLSPQEKRAWKRLQARFEEYLKNDPSLASKDATPDKGISEPPLTEVHDLLRLNQDRMGLRIEQMNRLEEKTIQVGVLWATLSLLATGLLAFFLIRSITRPIEILQKATRKIAEGKFAHRVDLPTHDELGDLAEAFNEMAYQLKRLDDMKAHFVAIVSHDLKTPLTSMREAVDLLLEEAVGPLSPKQRRLLEINAGGIQKLAEFVDDMLNLTRMEAGLVPLNQTWFDLQHLVEERLDAFYLLAERKQIRLSVTHLPDPLPHMVGDPGRLEQVLANLLNNAIHFTPCGGTIHVKVECVSKKDLPLLAKKDPRGDKTKRWLKFSISDMGEGIPKEEWNRVFDKFYQIRKASNQSTGSGLGLAIAKYIVEGHQGSIWIESSSRKGTTFVFVLPQDGVSREKRTAKDASTEDLLHYAS